MYSSEYANTWTKQLPTHSDIYLILSVIVRHLLRLYIGFLNGLVLLIYKRFVLIVIDIDIFCHLFYFDLQLLSDQ